jgi:hypothetical protein
MNAALVLFAEHLRNSNYPLEQAERAHMASIIEVLDHESARRLDALQRIALMTGFGLPGEDLAAALPSHIALVLAGEK